MTGHGHVTPNPDGLKARCGGPGLCRECAAELAGQVTVTVDGGPPVKGEIGTLPPGVTWPGLPDADPRQASPARWMPYPVVDCLHQLEHGGRLYWLRINVTAELVGEQPAGASIPARTDWGPRIADMIRADVTADAASTAT